MHPLLARQIASCTAGDGSFDLERFQSLVGSAYQDEERSRARLERAMRLMDEEMTEMNRQIQSQALESVARFITSASTPLLVVEPGGMIVLANREFGRLVGHKRRDLSGQQLAVHLVMETSLETMAEQGEISCKVRRSDGAEVDVFVGFSNAQLADTRFLIVSMRDETERKERMAAMEAARASAEAANSAKSAFLAMMSHELRTPLNALLGSADLLARTSLDVRQQSYVRMFNEAGQLMLALLNDVLDYSKIEAGQLELELAPFDLAGLVDELPTMWGPQAERRGLTLTVDQEGGEDLWLVGDGMRLRQVVFNLVSNAIKFTAKGEVRVGVRVAARGGAAQLAITVADTGIGIPADRLASIFSPFVQADSSVTRRYGGTGLGLSIARSLVRQMGGDLSVSSTVGAGSTFTVTASLPVAQASIGKHTGTAELDVANLRVLAVDDNPLNRRILAAMLDLLTVDTAWAENGVEALEALGRQAFDVVLMDVQMPVMDGLTATRRLRAQTGPNQHVHIIALTANAREEDRQACLSAGMDDFLTKPIKPDALFAALATVGEAEARTEQDVARA